MKKTITQVALITLMYYIGGCVYSASFLISKWPLDSRGPIVGCWITTILLACMINEVNKSIKP